MVAASLGHYASLSLVVVGRRRDWDLERHGAWGVNPEVGGQRTEDRWQSTDENSLFEILRFKERVAQMKSILIAFFLNYRF